MRKIILLVIIGLFFTGCSQYKDELILEGYTSSDEYWDKEGFQDYTDYCKYYYN